MKLEHVIVAGALAALAVVGCGSDDDMQTGTGAHGGKGGTAGRGSGGSSGGSGKAANGKGGKGQGTGGGSAASGGSSARGGKGGSTGGTGASTGGTTGGTLAMGATGGTSANAGESGMSGAAGAEPVCVDFTAVVSDLVKNRTADDTEPVPLAEGSYCADAEDPHAFDALF